MFKRLLANEKLVIAVGYGLFMLVFYLIGVTKAQFDSFVAIVLLTGVYAGAVLAFKKIRGE